MGDCIESLLAYDDACKQHQRGEVDTVDAACFFREMSYTYYRISRVLEGDYYTTRKLSKGCVKSFLQRCAPAIMG